MRPPIFFGPGGGTVAMVVAFWIVFYVWIGLEGWLGYMRRRLPTGATDRDSGSKAWVIGSVWVAVAVGIGAAFAFPGAAIQNGRSAVFVAGLLMLAGLALRVRGVLGASFTVDAATRGSGGGGIGSLLVDSPSVVHGGLLTVLGAGLLPQPASPSRSSSARWFATNRSRRPWLQTRRIPRLHVRRTKRLILLVWRLR
jgi:hypothetical protein